MLEFLHKALAPQPQPGKPPEKSSVEVISLSDIESQIVYTVVAAWRKWRGLHAMPPREKLALRDLGPAASHVSLARVIDEGEDYEFRIIGDAHVRAYGTSYQNKRLSDVMRVSPRFGKQLKASYDLVRTSGHPFAVRGLIGQDVPDAGFAWFETCYLPLGTGGVDHVINVAVYTPRSEAFA
jgi:hypothetical protein